MQGEYRTTATSKKLPTSQSHWIYVVGSPEYLAHILANAIVFWQVGRHDESRGQSLIVLWEEGERGKSCNIMSSMSYMRVHEGHYITIMHMKYKPFVTYCTYTYIVRTDICYIQLY